MKSGNHQHFCPKCQKLKPCQIITHCRWPYEAVCMDCYLPAAVAELKKLK